MRTALRARLWAWTRPRQPEPLPVRLDSRRVYILPTRFGVFYAALLLVMLLGALNYNNNPALLLGLLLAGAGLASLVAAQLQLTGLAIIAIDAEPVAAGRALLLRVHAQADTGRPRRGLRVELRQADIERTDSIQRDQPQTDPLQIRPVQTEPAHARSARTDPTPVGKRAQVRADPPSATPACAVLNLDHGHGEAQLALPTRRRGWLELPRLQVGTTRPLGLARAWAWVWPQHRLLVYPAPEAHGPPLPVGGGDRVRSRLHASGDDVHHLRSYRSGDSRRAIAWKPSARRDSLLVREYEQPLGADVVLDWQGLHGLASEARIARLARWIDDAEGEGRRYRLHLPGQPGISPGHGADHRHTCLRALALLPHG